jgi:Ca-activated chloride channel family protein
MSAGLKVGGDSVMGMKNGEKVLVFLSDGRHNTGDVHPADQAKILKDNGIRIFTVGFGDDRDDNMLMRVASSPDDYFSAKNPGELKKAFGTLGKIMCR